MEVVYPCCCGLDVHQKNVTACLLTMALNGERQKELRTFGTMTDDLLALADWLVVAGCTHVAMESTGVYWKPIYSAPGKACAQGRRWFSETEQSSPTGASPVRSKPNQQTGNESCAVHGQP
jgi:hypothetical protein